MGEKKESKFARYLGMSLSKFQSGIYEGPGKKRRLRIFWPFKFVLFILISLWRWIFKRKQ